VSDKETVQSEVEQVKVSLGKFTFLYGDPRVHPKFSRCLAYLWIGRNGDNEDDSLNYILETEDGEKLTQDIRLRDIRSCQLVTLRPAWDPDTHYGTLQIAFICTIGGMSKKPVAVFTGERRMITHAARVAQTILHHYYLYYLARPVYLPI